MHVNQIIHTHTHTLHPVCGHMQLYVTFKHHTILIYVDASHNLHMKRDLFKSSWEFLFICCFMRVYVSEYVCACVCIMLCECLCVCNWISEESVGVSFNDSLPIPLSESFSQNLGLMSRLGQNRASSSKTVSTSPWGWGYSFCWDAWHLRHWSLSPAWLRSKLSQRLLVCYLNILRTQLMPAVVGFGKPGTQDV